MRLNVGCGERRLTGYTGVDAADRSAADIKAPANKIPVADGTAEEVLAIHLVEHLLPWEVQGTLAEWYRVMKSGGRLVIEAPDIIKCCRNIVNGIEGKHPDQLGMWGCYGDPRTKDPFMLHRWGWCFKTLQPLVSEVGFINVTEHLTQFHGIGRGVRDFRLEAIKP